MLSNMNKLATFSTVLEGKVQEMQAKLATAVDSDAIITELPEEVVELNSYIDSLKKCNVAANLAVVDLGKSHPELLQQTLDLVAAQEASDDTSDDSDS